MKRQNWLVKLAEPSYFLRLDRFHFPEEVVEVFRPREQRRPHRSGSGRQNGKSLLAVAAGFLADAPKSPPPKPSPRQDSAALDLVFADLGADQQPKRLPWTPA